MKKEEQELEVALAKRMLDCLGAAIDEAQHSRQDIKSDRATGHHRPESFYVERLQFLDREIACLEALQQKIRNKINDNRVLNRSA